jgi:lipoprotein-anchoring transpeptidase ErfK/SrfK
MMKVRYLFPLVLVTSLSVARPHLAQSPITPSSESSELNLNLPSADALSNTETTSPNLEETTVITEPEAEPTIAVVAPHLVLKLKERKVYVYQGNKVLASYPVAIGKKGWETPKGNFQVIQLVENPIWQNPWNGNIVPAGPKNPLGERWIGFWTDGKNYIGFHGTTAENLIGQAVSHGCVRMRNKDIKEMFENVKIGTPVIVVY